LKIKFVDRFSKNTQILWKSVPWEPSCSMRTDWRTDRRTDGQTDRRTEDMTKLIVASLNFANRPKSGANSGWNEKEGTVNVKKKLWRCCVRHCTTNRKVAGSIPDDVIGSFHWPNPFGRTPALGSILRRGARTLVCQVSRNSEILNLLETEGPVQARIGMVILLFTYV